MESWRNGDLSRGSGHVVVTVAAAARNPRAFPASIAAAVAAYITAAYWFTASTSFANPAVTLARALSDSFAGIAPTSVPAFLLAQATGAAAAVAFSRWLFEAPR
jgi:glycerol uptake facilitator-like aquaporin